MNFLHLPTKKWGKLLPLVLFSLVLTGCASESDFLDALGYSSGVLRIILILVGILYLLAGYKIHQFIIQLTGFIFGGLLGSIILGAISDNLQGLLAIVGFIVGGLLGAGIALFLAELGIFLTGALVGAVLGALMSGGGMGSDAGGILLFACIFGIIGGIVFLALFKAWIIGVTSLIGSVLIGISTGADFWVYLILFLVGLGVQYGLAKATEPEKATSPPPPPKPQITQSSIAPQKPLLPPKENSLEIAKKRLAAGEISEEEFNNIINRLKD